jgi:threonine/homoserine/homoserine lactone efflux protein
MLSFLLRGLGLGLAAGAQPGPIQTFLLNLAARHGFRRTALAAFAPLVSDGPIIALTLLVLRNVPPALQRGLYIAGGLYIIWLALEAWRSWRQFTPNEKPAQSGRGEHLWKAALTNLLNPAPYIFWSTVNGLILLESWAQSPWWGLAFLLGFYGALIGVNLLVIWLGDRAAARIPALQKALLALSALLLFFFGLWQLWRGLRL